MAEKQKEVIRDENGRFVPGKSGNPKGRPLGARSRIVKAKQELELLLREQIVDAEQIRSIWLSMVAEAQNGNVSAAKLILDKVVSQAAVNEDVTQVDNGMTIVVKNLSLNADVEQDDAIEGEYTEE